jgi:hypothetical protein
MAELLVMSHGSRERSLGLIRSTADLAWWVQVGGAGGEG